MCFACAVFVFDKWYFFFFLFFFKQKTAYEMDGYWSSDVCSSDLACRTSPGCTRRVPAPPRAPARRARDRTASARRPAAASRRDPSGRAARRPSAAARVPAARRSSASRAGRGSGPRGSARRTPRAAPEARSSSAAAGAGCPRRSRRASARRRGGSAARTAHAARSAPSPRFRERSDRDPRPTFWAIKLHAAAADSDASLMRLAAANSRSSRDASERALTLLHIFLAASALILAVGALVLSTVLT